MRSIQTERRGPMTSSFDEIRSAGGESQKEGQEGIDREVGGRAFAVQMLAAAHRASLTRNRNEPAKGQTLTVEAS